MRDFAYQHVFGMKLVHFTTSSYTAHYIVKNSEHLFILVLPGIRILAIFQI
jgi:hypothetical protein